jgi:SAM-dependent methyltransferase
MSRRPHRAPHHAIRYAPVIRRLRRLPRDARVLEVGAGVEGVGAFWPGPFVGADLAFPGGPRVSNLVPVVADGTNLPFPDGVFDLVVCVDVLPEIPDAIVPAVCREMARVARGTVIVVSVAGADAEASDRRTLDWLDGRRGLMPDWLVAQARDGVPAVETITDALAPYGRLRRGSNTSVEAHERLFRFEHGLRRARVMTAIQPFVRAWGRHGARELSGEGTIYRHRFALEIQPTPSPPRTDS